MSNISITPGSGAIVGTDDIGGGVTVQKVKVDIGTAGNSVLWGSAALADATATPTVPKIASFPHGLNGTTWDQIRTVQGITDSYNGLGLAVSANVSYDGTSWNKTRGNVDLTILASATRTATVTSTTQTNYNGKGVHVFLNVTAASGTGGLTLTVNGIDPVSTSSRAINSNPTAVTTTGLAVYTIYPGISGGNATQATGAFLPRTWSVTVTHGDASNYAYSVGASLIL